MFFSKRLIKAQQDWAAQQRAARFEERDRLVREAAERAEVDFTRLGYTTKQALVAVCLRCGCGVADLKLHSEVCSGR